MTNDQPDANFIKKHVGHDLKYLAFAAVEFGNPEGSRYQTNLQTSALAHGRTLIDFFINFRRDENVYIRSFYEEGVRAPDPPPNTGKWYGFICARVAHVGRAREVDEDTWPGRRPGEQKGEDRLERLARLIVALIRTRIPAVTENVRQVLTTMADRAEEYLNHPNEPRFHAMDPANQ